MARTSTMAATAVAMFACGGPVAMQPPVDDPAVGPRPESKPTVVEPAPPPEGLRLPDHVRPTAYELEIDLDPDQPVFSGRVSIELDVAEPISSLWINSVGLTLEDTALVVADRRIEATLLHAPDNDQVVGLSFGETIAAGKARLDITYTGTMGNRVGLFRQRQGGDWYSYTDFEPTDARRALPCFDDPRFKVPWTVSLIVKPDHLAFANTPSAGEDPLEDGRRRVRFAKTRPLPSYLVAFAAGPFDVVDGAHEPAPIRVIVPRGRGSEARYALDASPELLALLAEYFDAPVPYRKVDLISVPRMSGAMENPGLITVGSRILLLDGTATLQQQRLLTLVLTHEFAHLWFGDLVTMSWWDDLWLNEGFATWMADKTIARWKPEWAWQLEAVAGKTEAMSVDSDPNAGAIRHHITKAEDIRGAFGPITYKKGGAVLAMFEAWLGADDFRAGVRAYVRDHADGTATAADLLDALSAVAKRDVATPFRSFLDRPGLPTIAATLHCENGVARVEVEQSRYRFVGDTPSGSTENWQVPICVRHPEGKDCALLDSANGTVALTAKTCPAWIHPNADEAGYYRYTLTAEGLGALAQRGASSLSDAERAGLIANIRAGLQSGRVAIADALPALRAIAATDGVELTRGIIGAVTDLREAARGAGSSRRYAAFVQKIYGKRARRLGLVPRKRDSATQRRLRPMLTELVGDHGEDKRLRARARRLARRFLKDRGAIDPTMQSTVFTLAGIGGDAALFDDMVAALAETKLRGEREALLLGLASFTEPELTKRALTLAMSGELGRRESLEIFRAIVESPHTRELGYTYFQGHYDEIMKQVPPPVRPFMPYIAAGFCTVERADDVNRFFRDRLGEVKGADRVIELVVAQILRCDAFRAHHQADAKDFFD